MTPKEQFIASVEAAKLETDWSWDIIAAIPDLYARGYIDGMVSWWNESGTSFVTEDFRERLLKVARFNIWDK